MNTGQQYWKPERVFLYIAAFVCALHLYFVPPFQAPDEFAHFYRAYSISEGNFLPVKKDARVGASLPAQLEPAIEDFYYGSVNLKHKFDGSHDPDFWETRLNDSLRKFYDFPNTSYYSPVSYLPQAFMLRVLKPLRLTVGQTFYLTKAFVLILWLIGFYFTIRLMPVYKYLFSLLALLPMNVYLANSFSADTMTILPAFLFGALVLKHALREDPLKKSHLAALFLLAVTLSLAKLVYAPLVLFVLMIKADRFPSKPFSHIYKLTLVAVSFALAAWWSSVVMQCYTPFFLYNQKYVYSACISPCANYEAQKFLIVNYPSYFPSVLWRSLFEHPYTYLHGYVGNLGNSDIPLPRYLVTSTYAFIFILLFFENNPFGFNTRQRLVLLAGGFLSFVFLLLSQHLTWDCPGEGIVDLLQGRYLIPLFPWLFLALSGKKRISARVSPAPALIFFVAFSHGVSILRVSERFYADEHVSETHFICDAEQRTAEGMFLTSDSAIRVKADGCITGLHYWSDTSSVKLNYRCPFGFTWRTKLLDTGDLVDITVRHRGNPCNFVRVLEGAGCELYESSPVSNRLDTGKWEAVRKVFTVTRTCDSSVYYFWNPDTLPCYLDHLEIRIRKFPAYISKSRKRLSFLEHR